jgi:hypothetical protein
MNRSRTTLAVALVALASLGGCSRGVASQSDVQGKVEDLLTNKDDRPEDQLYPGAPLDATDAAGAAACVAQALFDPNQFPKDERNRITSSPDGDLPNQEIVQRFEATVEQCVSDATAVAPEGPGVSTDDDNGNDDESTTTERQSSSRSTATTADGN